ncbi:MAG: hypothetical protein ACM3JG_17975 [Thiohalocapsa sp.]
MSDQVMLAAETAARRWTAPASGSIRPGSEEHKIAFCRMLLDTHNPYKPAVVEWPLLGEEARRRLVSLPIWDIAVQTEGKASTRVLSYAAAIADPLLQEAVRLNGFEEARHKEVLANLVAAYGIPLAPEPEYRRPKHPRWAFLITGLSECIDSFFAFGLFAVARQSRFFPPELVETFEPVMQEEARHILFFVNWLAWYRRNLEWWRRPWFYGVIAAAWIRLVRERIGMARGVGASRDEAPQDNNFTLTGSKQVSDIDISPAALFDLCLRENERRMAGYDARLLRPQTMPCLVRLACRFLRKPRPVTSA